LNGRILPASASWTIAGRRRLRLHRPTMADFRLHLLDAQPKCRRDNRCTLKKRGKRVEVLACVHWSIRSAGGHSAALQADAEEGMGETPAPCSPCVAERLAHPEERQCCRGRRNRRDSRRRKYELISAQYWSNVAVDLDSSRATIPSTSFVVRHVCRRRDGSASGTTAATSRQLSRGSPPSVPVASALPVQSLKRVRPPARS